MELLENPTYFWGLIGVTVIVLGLWLYRRAHHNAADNELFNNMGDAYFESDPLLDNEPQARNTEQGLETEMNTFAQSMDSNSSNELEPSENAHHGFETETVTDGKPEAFKDKIKETDKPPKPAKKSRPEPELIIALFILPRHEEGFLGTDIFTVLQDQNMSYGKMEIFHHYGVGEIKVKHAIFSVANILNPGIFNPNEMDDFYSAGLVFFMQLPGAFGGRVTFELMLNTAKRVAENLEGTLTNEQQYILDQDMIDGLRDKITQFELEKEQILDEN